MPSSGLLRRVALVRIDVSEEHSASFIKVTRIGALGTTLAVYSDRSTLRRNTFSFIRVTRIGELGVLLVTANFFLRNIASYKGHTA
jgi:hypothetical protein